MIDGQNECIDSSSYGFTRGKRIKHMFLTLRLDWEVWSYPLCVLLPRQLLLHWPHGYCIPMLKENCNNHYNMYESHRYHFICKMHCTISKWLIPYFSKSKFYNFKFKIWKCVLERFYISNLKMLSEWKNSLQYTSIQSFTAMYTCLWINVLIVKF